MELKEDKIRNRTVQKVIKLVTVGRVINRRLEILSKYYNKIYAKTFKTLMKCMISFLKIILFLYLFLAVLGLHCCTAFSVITLSGGCSLVVVLGLVITVASLVAEDGALAYRLQ